MDFIWISFAFICGLIAKGTSLPPSIGYLAAGFALNMMGYQSDDSLTLLSDLGITLMLFTIGLKLDVKNLFKTEVWLGSSLHTLTWIIACISIFKLFALFSISYFSELDIITATLIAFALSFSSTVCVIKLLEENGEMRTRHGKLAVSILVIQDIVAVAFLVVATGKTPSIWAFSLLGLFLIKPLINRMINYVGHGELIPLAGFFIALGSYELFELVNIKGDLGALIIGMFLASHQKATEINKALMSFKDLFLIGFFLSIGFTAVPTLEMLGLASMLMLLIPIKFALFYGIFTLLKMRCRSAFLSALSLSNFSEFGLIVGALSVSAGWLSNDWLVILALAVSLSFILTTVIYSFSHVIFSKYRPLLAQFERDTKLEEDIFTQPCKRPIVIIGMGRVGMGAYRAINNHSESHAWGLDADKEKITWLNEQNIEAYYGDAEDIHFWESIDLSQIELVLLALPAVQDAMNITTQLKGAKYQGKIAAVARYEDERIELQEYGIDKVFNFYTEAGVGFAEESLALLDSLSLLTTTKD
ncbi:cation:proton antiporter [Colwellia sp. D2M02]|uniref:cation:proton antiporter family protein n=1 Tax=Colwellia sp. D2M02 TaxID=2841562 RepID=UPI001C08CDBF|nr:cation:proton antiporter family protein [Colwellia sp. D2M02]MBU2892587.1 cation:proton antiporter [Colwellia sp. D2M02]